MYQPYAHTTINMKRLTETAILPKRADAGSVGYDLYADSEHLIHAGQRAIIKTGIAMAIPAGLYGRVADRSSIAWKRGGHVIAGVIDPSYRGEIGVVMVNLSDEPITINKSEKIAQLILEHVATPFVVEVDSLDDTARGVGGFGSTGNY